MCGVVVLLFKFSISAILFVLIVLSNPPPYAFEPNRYLDDAVFAPVADEMSHGPLSPSVGRVPSHLFGGVYLRNGPNPVVKSLPYHWFDGDGMLFQVAFSHQGTVTLRNKWIVTDQFRKRNATGKATYFLAEIQYGWRAAKALLSLANSTYHGTTMSTTTANTALLWYKGRLFALMEAAAPIELDPITLDTLPMFTFGGKLRGSVTAHPKYDAESDELLFFGYIPPSSALRYNIFSPSHGFEEWRIDFSENGTTPRHIARTPHDFAVTKHYTIWFDVPAMRMNPMAMLGLGASGSLPHMPCRAVWHERRSSITRSVPIDEGQAFHFVNAWEDGDDIVVLGCKSTKASGFFDPEIVQSTPYLYEWRISAAGGSIMEGRLHDQNGDAVPMEFPSINPSRAMKSIRFLWGMLLSSSGPDETDTVAVGVVKYDYETEHAVRYVFGEGKRSQEPVFISKGGPNESEDSGSVLTFMFDPATLLSSLIILDAKTMELSALIPLQTRVPMGFHTLFISEAELRAAVSSALSKKKT